MSDNNDNGNDNDGNTPLPTTIIHRIDHSNGMSVEAGTTTDGFVILGLHGPSDTHRRHIGEVVNGQLSLQIGIDTVTAATLWVLLTTAIVGMDRMDEVEAPREVVEMLGGSGWVQVRSFPIVVVDRAAVVRAEEARAEAASSDVDDSGVPN